jgi:hypothetical protein
MPHLPKSSHVSGRPRSLNDEKKAELCQLVHDGATLDEAAVALAVSRRTLQREMKLDPDFHRDLCRALTSTPDPRKLVEGHARTHWRAAAWLLERTQPERYARRPPTAVGPDQVDRAFTTIIEAALEATPADQRPRVYDHVQAAALRAIRSLFPSDDPLDALAQFLPPAAPLVDKLRYGAAGASPPNPHFTPDNSVLPMIPMPADGLLSPKKRPATKPPSRDNTAPCPPRPPHSARHPSA